MMTHRCVCHYESKPPCPHCLSKETKKYIVSDTTTVESREGESVMDTLQRIALEIAGGGGKVIGASVRKVSDGE